MSRIGRPLRVGIVGALSVLIATVPVYAAASNSTPATFQYAETPDVIITEFQTNGGSASQEFIELYNSTDNDISFDGTDPAATDVTDETDDTASQLWKLQFFGSSSVKGGTPDWDTAPTTNNTITLTGTISAHDYFLISSSDYLPGGVTPDMTYSASSSHLMTDTGGALQLLSTDPTTATTTSHDQVMWLAQPGAAGILKSPASGKSLQRIPNDDSEYVDDDGAVFDFGSEDWATPLAAWVAPAIAEPEVTATEEDDSTSSVPVSNEGLLAPQITELLPNPASPLTDADDEFIELYNSNSAAFDVSGYKLEVGTSTLHTYTIPAGTVLAPLSYQTFYSSETGLSLSNSGGQVRFRDPAGALLQETEPYGSAGDNEAWIMSDGVWQWTATATPAAANILAAPTTKKTTKKAATKAKTTKTKTTKAKATTKKKAKKTTTTAAAVTIPEKPKPPIHMGILVGVAAAAVLYGLYEYRHDIILKFKQLGGNRKAGLRDRLAPAGR